MGTQALVFVKMTLESGQGLEMHGHRAGALRDKLQDACGPRVGKCSCWNPWAAVLGCEWEAASLVCSTAFACEAKRPTLATVQSIQGNNLKRRRDGKEEEERFLLNFTSSLLFHLIHGERMKSSLSLGLWMFNTSLTWPKTMVSTMGIIIQAHHVHLCHLEDALMRTW